MANNKATFEIVVDDNGTLSQTTTKAKELNSELKSAASNAAKSTASFKAAKGRSEGSDYRSSRGTVGTGAESRDFAKQSQGLGGLVRVYATFAANMFAVGAAFNALKAAADTSNMVKGLDQLGAASGRNLGTLAKDIVKVTDNAVSLREAMTATAQASAAGMSNKDILRMAEGAKKASQALGIDMSDALSRISRGITKLEPELLDEIGIFIRVDRAVQEYAKSIGKPVSALSELERRSAFAAGALKQVEEKFGGIKIDSNPYTQLAASFKNVASSGGEMINNVIGPLVKLLAQSPTALSLAITGIAFTLLNQAMPAITSFRQNLRDAADETARSAKETTDTFRTMKELVANQTSNKLRQVVKVQSDASEAAMKSAAASLERGADIGASTVTKLGAKFQKGILQDSDLDTALKSASKLQRGAENTANSYDLDRRRLDSEKAAAIRTYVAELRIAKTAREDLTKAEAVAQASLAKKAGVFSQEGMLTKITQNTEAASARARIIANAADNASFVGPVTSFKLLKAEINSSTVAMGAFGKAATYTRGAIAILGATASTAMAAFGPIIALISLVTAATVALVSAFRSNNDEIEATGLAIARLDSSSKAVAGTMEHMSRLNPMKLMSSESLTARATAMQGLAESMADAISSTEREISKRNSVSSATNWISGLWSGDSETVLAESVANGLVKAIELARKSPELAKNLPGLLELAGGSSATKESITKRFKETPGLIAKSSALLASDAAAAKASAASNTELSDSLKSISKSRTDVLNTFNINDPVTKLGDSFIMSASKMTAALRSPEDSLQNIINAAEDLVSTGLFSTQQSAQLATYGSNLATISAQFLTAKTNAAELERKLFDLESKNKALSLPNGIKINSPEANRQRAANDTGIAQVKAAQQANNAVLDNGRKVIAEASKGLATSVDFVFAKGVGYVARGIDAAFARAGLTLEKAKAQGIAGTTQAIDVDASLQKRELDIQIAQVRVMQNLIKSVELNTLATDEGNLLKQLENEKGKAAGPSSVTLGRLEGVRAQRQIVESGGNSVRVLESLFKGASSQEARDAILRKLPFAQQASSQNAKVAELSAQRSAVDVTAGYAKKDKTAADAAKKMLEDDTAALNKRKEQLTLDKEAGILSEAEVIRRQSLLDLDQNRLNLANTLAGLESRLDKAKSVKGSGDAVREIQGEIDQATKLSKDADGLLRNTAKVSGTRAGQKATEAYLTNEAEIQSALYQDSLDTQVNSAEVALAKLEVENTANQVGTDTYKRRSSTLQLELLSLQAEKDKFALTASIAAKQRVIDKEVEDQKDPNTSESVKEATRQKQKELNDEYFRGEQAIHRSTEAQRSAIIADARRTEAVTILENHIVSSADTLMDAFFDATQSGKYDFTDMVNSMILDLARLEMKASMLSALKDSGGISAAGGWLSKLLGGSSAAGGVTDASAIADMEAAGTVPALAKGAAYASGGVQAFAKGGTFANSVVDSPTLFKFAKGTGLMGEAGPEAIMPLKRDANGRLGVSAANTSSGSNTNVVVNNYSGQAVETHESVDSRGQRKIEVSIGNMVAGEISRLGSGANQAIKSTFGQKPQLIRR